MPLVEIYRMDDDNTETSYAAFIGTGGRNLTKRLPISVFENETEFDIPGEDDDDDRKFPDKTTVLQDVTFSVDRTQTDNPAPHQEEVKKPDTGFAGMTYTLRLMFMSGTVGLDMLRKWTVDSNRVRRKFRHGRFGIKFDNNRISSGFDVHPSNNKGLKISRFEVPWNPNNSSVVGTLVMELSGGS